MNTPARPAWKRKRPAPRGQGLPQLLRNDDITWSRTIEPRERYRVQYIDRDGERSERLIELQRLGEVKGVPYLGVVHAGKFKTLRADRIAEVEQLTSGHAPSIRAWQQLDYSATLPPYPGKETLFRIPTIAKSSRSWTVDLRTYTCTCPEKRIRLGFGFTAGQLGFVCPHVARAIVAHLPLEAGWSEELLSFLRDPRKVHIDNLVNARDKHSA